MLRWLLLAAALLAPWPAAAQNSFLTPGGASVPGIVTMCIVGNLAVPCTGGSVTPVLTSFAVSAPASVVAGTPFNFSVTALDQFSNPFTTYAGTVHFTSTDGAAVLPANSTLVAGVRTFSATLNTVATQRISVNDVATPAITGISGPIVVQPSAPVCTGAIDLTLGCAFPVGMGWVLL
jgi:hypothetical protein